jgi:ribonuclease BN (tRNA processing enzyme)
VRVTIIGTSAAFAAKDESCASYLITAGQKNYVIDIGSGSFGVLQRYIHYKDIDCIFLSHLHADHCSDIYTLRYAIYVAQRDGLMGKALPIYMPKSPKRTFNFIREAIKNEFAIEEITEGLTINLNNLKVSFLRGEHPVQCYAMKFDYNGNIVVYTADTKYFDDLILFSWHADLLIAEATLQDKDRSMEEMGHMTARSAAMLARDADVKKLVLTHIWPEYDRRETYHEAKSCYDGELVVGKRGLPIDL